MLFSEVVQALLSDGHDTFLEVSAHPVLLSAVQQGLSHRSRDGTLVPSLRRDEDERAVILGSVGALYAAGHQPNWSRLYQRRGRFVRFPPYPWQRERCWTASGENGEPANRVEKRRGLPQPGGAALSPLLGGACLNPAVDPATYVWQEDIDTIRLPYLADHRVHGSIVLPAAACIGMIWAAGFELFGHADHVLEKLLFLEVLSLPNDGGRTVQLVASVQSPERVLFRLFSRPAAGPAPPKASEWVLHATGTLRLSNDEPVQPDEHASPAEIRARCPEVRSSVEHYLAAKARGLQDRLQLPGS